MIVALPSFNCCRRFSQTEEDAPPRRRYWRICSENMTHLDEFNLLARTMFIAGMITMIVVRSPTNQPLLWSIGFFYTCVGLGGLYFGGESVVRLLRGLSSEARRNSPEEILTA